eukprot:m.63398 g.63398  ORF g.63398 m.63398 type:complete len:61 (-) comp11435_c0_seq1:966-1148(-)
MPWSLHLVPHGHNKTSAHSLMSALNSSPIEVKIVIGDYLFVIVWLCGCVIVTLPVAPLIA